MKDFKRIISLLLILILTSTTSVLATDFFLDKSAEIPDTLVDYSEAESGDTGIKEDTSIPDDSTAETEDGAWDDTSAILDACDTSIPDVSISDTTIFDFSIPDSSIADSIMDDSKVPPDESLTDTSIAEETIGDSAYIKDGLYVIQSALNQNACIGIAGNAKANSANVQLVTRNGGFGQAFYIKDTGGGKYTITNYHTGKLLHIPGNAKNAGANVVQYADRNINTQKWYIEANDNLVTIQSVANNLVLDCAGGKSVINTNVCLNKNTSGAKRMLWKLVPASGKVAVFSRLQDADIQKGYYKFNLHGTNLCLHIASASKKAGASIILRPDTPARYQTFHVLPQGGGLYRIKNVLSGKYIGTSNGSGNIVNIIQKEYNRNDKSLLWYIQKDPETNKLLLKPSCATYNVMSSRGASTGKNVLNNTYTNSELQYWDISKTTAYPADTEFKPAEGAYYILPASVSTRTVGIDKGKMENGTNVQLTTLQDSNALKWRIMKNGDGTYRILNVKSGKAFDVYAGDFSAGTNIHQYTANNTAAQKWTFLYTGAANGGIYITSAKDSFVTDIKGGNYANSANVNLNNKNRTGTQKYLLKKADIKYEGWITAASGNRFYYQGGNRVKGWKKINSIYYYFDKSSGRMLRNTTFEGFTFDAEGVSNKTDTPPVVAKAPAAVTGGRTLRALLTNAVSLAGKVLYVWGGGWDDDASVIGQLPSWNTFYQNWAKPNYTDVKDQFQFMSGLGLDCSGFAAWAVYNTLYTKTGQAYIVQKSTSVASTYISKGWCYDSGGTYKPGDIVSRDGHVWISMGTCSDGSVLIMHSSIEGSQLTATYGKSIELAQKYMKIAAPNWPYAIHVYGQGYLNYVGKATWRVDGSGILADPDGMQNMSAEQVCKTIFGS